jgi:hypothetical protein
MKKQFEVGVKVAPRFPTRSGLTYGYIRWVDSETGEYAIYWPEISSEGCGWSGSDLVAL